MKKCSRCKRELPKTDFCKHKRSRDGLQSHCRRCHADYMRERDFPVQEDPQRVKRCSVCGTDYPATLAYFCTNKKRTDGMQGICKRCHNDETQTWRKDHPIRAKEINKKSQLRKALRKLGMTENDFDTLLREQNNKCAICGSDPPQNRTTRLHIDHDHATGTHRGLLCPDCNTALGLLQDSPIILTAAIEYLKRWRSLPINP